MKVREMIEARPCRLPFTSQPRRGIACPTQPSIPQLPICSGEVEWVGVCTLAVGLHNPSSLERTQRVRGARMR